MINISESTCVPKRIITKQQIKNRKYFKQIPHNLNVNPLEKP